MWKESKEKDNGRHINGDVELGAFGGGGQQQEDNHVRQQYEIFVDEDHYEVRYQIN
jgi:hypothetical protein